MPLTPANKPTCRKHKTPQKTFAHSCYAPAKWGVQRASCPLAVGDTPPLRSRLQKYKTPHKAYTTARTFIFAARKKAWERQFPINLSWERPNTGGEKRVIVRHRRSDADNGCPPKAADGSQEHTENRGAITARERTEVLRVDSEGSLDG